MKLLLLLTLTIATAATAFAAPLGEELRGAHPEAQWLGLNLGGILWDGQRPLMLQLRHGNQDWSKAWGNGKFFEIVFADGSPARSNLDYPAPEISREGDTWTLRWHAHQVCRVDLTVTLQFSDEGERIALGFAIDNQSDSEIRSLQLPCGWPEPKREQAEFIVPAWVGAAIPLQGMAPLSMVSPGQLHSQWFGLQDPAGFSWMLRCDDTEYNLKSLSVGVTDDTAEFSWGHELWLKPGRSYRAGYLTILELLPEGDWNRMAALYREWAMKQRWFVTAEQKLRERPGVAVLRQGWSWLRGMPPVKEVGGRQCDTTFAQALECMEGYRNEFNTDLLFWYTGWYGPFDSAYPEFLPVAEELQGDFKSFAVTAAERGNLVSVHTNSAEWNSGAKCFDRELMARWRGGYYENSYGDDHSNFVASLPLAKEKWLEVYSEIAASGIGGIYFDVLGHVIAHDDNPRAGYREDEIGRCNWTRAKVELWRSYREAMPKVFFQTEGNWEGAIPYLDAASGGDTGWIFSGGRRPLPLWQLTYGDTGFFMMLYDGMGQLNAARGFAVTPLFGAVQQLPQDLWRSRNAFWQHQLRRQKVAGALAARQMLAYQEADNWRVSEWANGIVAVNDAAVRDGVFPSEFGELNLQQAREMPNGAVTIVTADGLSTDGATTVTLDGRILWQCDDNQIAATLTPEKLWLYNPTAAARRIHITVPELTNNIIEVPAGAIVAVER